MPGAANVTIRTATERDVDQLSGVLARAFQHDPVMSWIMRGERYRARRLPGMFAMMLRAVHPATEGAEVALRGDRILAGALWDPPGKDGQPSRGGGWRELRAVLRVFGWRWDALTRSGQIMRLLDAHRPRRPHWYLAQIGTEPEASGQGLGHALLSSRLAHCDTEGLPAYLESSTERNLPLYERSGFTVTHEVTLPRGPTIWPMWREPR